MTAALTSPDMLSAMLSAAREDAETGGEEGGAVAEASLLFELLDINRDGVLTRIEVTVN